jgi:hypothetical protein
MHCAGGAVKMECWLETAKFRTIQTGGRPILTQEGQLVALVIIDKWDNFEAAVEALRKLYKREAP